MEMVPLLQGRPANAIKNRFNATLLPRIRQAGRMMKYANPDAFDVDACGDPMGVPLPTLVEAVVGGAYSRRSRTSEDDAHRKHVGPHLSQPFVCP